MFGNANDEFLTWPKNDANTATTSWLPSIVNTNQYYNKNSHNLDVVPPCFKQCQDIRASHKKAVP